MSDDQVAMILSAVSNARNESTKAIGDLSATVSGYHADLNARVTIIEAAQKSEKTWSRVNRTLVPVYAIGHGVLAYFGIRV